MVVFVCEGESQRKTSRCLFTATFKEERRGRREEEEGEGERRGEKEKGVEGGDVTWLCLSL